MARIVRLPRITSKFIDTELAEIREHLEVLQRHADWLESEVRAIRGELDPNVRPIRPGGGPRPGTGT